MASKGEVFIAMRVLEDDGTPGFELVVVDDVVPRLQRFEPARGGVFVAYCEVVVDDRVFVLVDVGHIPVMIIYLCVNVVVWNDKAVR